VSAAMSAKGSAAGAMTEAGLQIRANLAVEYADVLTPSARSAIAALAALDAERSRLMEARIERRSERARNRDRIDFSIRKVSFPEPTSA
jgi:malate synthase